MDFHGIEMQGSFKALTVIDASALVWDEDEGKVVYDQLTEQIWIADDTDWKYGGQYVDTPLGTEMWFYSNVAPAGWQISAGIAGDELIAIKGSSGYAVGGTADGSWTTPAHAHNMNSHAHTFSGIIGNAVNPSPLHGREQGNDAAFYIHTHTATVQSVADPSPTSTSVNGTSTAYRPKGRVGLICERV